MNRNECILERISKNSHDTDKTERKLHMIGLLSWMFEEVSEGRKKEVFAYTSIHAKS